MTRAAIAVVAVPIVIGLLNTTLSRAQSPATPPKFETASVKPCRGGAADGRSGGGSGPSPGRLRLSCQDTFHFISGAYVLFANGRLNSASTVRISGGPPWINSDLYEINAKAEGPASWAMMNGPLLQAVLEDRFKLKIHRETREVPVYALTVAKGGPKLKPFKEGSCIPLDLDNPPGPPASGQPLPNLCGMLRGTNNGFDVNRVTMTDFCQNLSGGLDRGVIDRTGITGRFDIHLDLSLADLGYPVSRQDDPSAPASSPDPEAIFSAVNSAIQKLGLKLESAKGPGEFLVIDHVEKASEN
jgi:uncharacterized protein (TIGR03435 family)